jgi:hypothetical protein
MDTRKTRARGKKQAFVFTLDALLVLPLVILIISSLISFSSTLKENVLMHEYTYMVAKDSVNYLAELEIGQASVTGLYVPSGDESLTVLEFTIKQLSNTTARARAVQGTLNPRVPYFSGYIFEYWDGTHWVEIARGGNADKLPTGQNPGKYSFQVSAVKVVSGLSDPYMEFNGQIVAGPGQDYLSEYPCASGITCNTPVPLYVKGDMMGPMMFRIRVFS